MRPRSFLLPVLLLSCLPFAAAAQPPSSVDPIRAAAPAIVPGSRVHIEQDTGAGTGAGFDAKGDKIVQGENGSAPAVNAGSVTSKGGSSKSNTAGQGAPESRWSNPFLWASLLAFVCAGVAAYLQLGLRVVLACAGVGAGLLCAVFYPGPAVLIVAGTVVAFLAVHLWQSRSGVTGTSLKNEALRAMVAAAGDLPLPVQQFLEHRLGVHAEGPDISTINAVRNADGIPIPPPVAPPAPA